jgi:hypothetical protein
LNKKGYWPKNMHNISYASATVLTGPIIPFNAFERQWWSSECWLSVALTAIHYFISENDFLIECRFQ